MIVTQFELIRMKLPKHKKFTLGAVLLFCLSASDAYCNGGIPGTLLIAGSGSTVDPPRWIAVNMIMCITIEGAIYHYLQILDRPYLASSVANFVTLVAGVPLAILAVIDPTWVLLPTAASIYIEVVILKRFRKKIMDTESQESSHKDITGPVIAANLLTNFLMFLYLLKGALMGP